MEVFRKRKEGGLKLAANLQPGDDLRSSVLPEFRLPLAELGADMKPRSVSCYHQAKAAPMKTTELPLTVSDLEGTPDDGNRYELIEGEVHVSTAPGYFHQKVLYRLAFAMESHLQRHAVGEVVGGVGVIFDQFNGVIPDLVFLTHERKRHILHDNRLTAAPEIVVEILSPGSTNEKRDRTVKRRLYSARGVHEYWIIDSEAKTVDVYRKRKEGGLKLAANLHADSDLTSSVLPEFRLPLAQLFAE